MQKYYQEQIECAPLSEIKALQNAKLVKQVKHVYEHVPYYRALMKEKGVTPDDIKTTDDIRLLPFISKADLRDAYPYGLLAVPLSECVRIHSTSGTTGKRVVAFYTQHDIDLWEDCCARAITTAKLLLGDELQTQTCCGYTDAPHVVFRHTVRFTQLQQRPITLRLDYCRTFYLRRCRCFP